MRKLLSIALLFVSVCTFSQVSGEINDDKRVIANDIDYTLTSPKAGYLVYTISVDTDGNVAHCELKKTESTIKSTPMMMKGKNKIVGSLKFEKGTRYPKFHQGTVTITVLSTDTDPPSPPQ